MKFIATQKFVRMSPRKLRYVADMVRKLSPTDAVEVLPQIGKRAGEPLSKVVKTAIANAKQKGVSDTELELEEIQIGDGPQLKRGRPVSRGNWHPYIRRMSHIRVVLTTKEVEKVSASGEKSVKSKSMTVDSRTPTKKKSSVADKIKKTVARKKKVGSK